MELTKEYFDKALKGLQTHTDIKFDAMFEGFKSVNDTNNLILSEVKDIKQELEDLSQRDIDDSDTLAKTI